MVILDRITDSAKFALHKHMSIFGLNPDTEFDIQPYFREMTGEAGEFFPNAEIAERFFVLSGCVQLLSIKSDSTEFIHQFGIANWWVGDELSFAAHKPSDWIIQALQNSNVLVVNPDSQGKLIKEWPDFSMYLTKVYQRAYGALQGRVWFAASLSTRQRYDLFVNTEPEFVQQVPQHRLAAYLGITPEHLSRIRKERIRN